MADERRVTQNRFGFSDLLVDEDILPQKYVKVFDTRGNPIGEIQVYFIEEEEE